MRTVGIPQRTSPRVPQRDRTGRPLDSVDPARLANPVAAMTEDRIEIRGLRVSARCGVLPSERERAQPLEIDVDLVGDLARAGATDDLLDTADYGAVCDLIERVCTRESPHLLEHLAEMLANEVLGANQIDTVTVAVRKLRPPVPQQLATSGVRITRSRNSEEGRR